MNKTLTVAQVITKANILILSLKTKATKNPKVFKENYGQSEIIKFEDKYLRNIHISERKPIIDILYSISHFSPLD